MSFDECLKVILQNEGGYVDDPIDRGGATNKGITQTTYDNWRGATDKSVEFISDDEVAAIYKAHYWTDLPQLIDLMVFDAAVQHGKLKASKWLQQVVGVYTDGGIGANTLYALNQFILTKSTKELIQAYQALRRAFYAAIIARDPTQAKFKHGWDNRMDNLEKILYQ